MLRKIQYYLPCMLLLGSVVFAQTTQTMGLFQNDSSSFNGYTLFAPLTYEETYLIDNNGLLVNSWQSEHVVGNSVYLLENGDLLRACDPMNNTTFLAGGDAGCVERYDWDGNLVWRFDYSSTQYRHHHDIEPLPNGNVLILAWEFRSDSAALAAGRDPNLLGTALWPEHIVEVEPADSVGGNIVWEWHLWDHLIQDYDSTKENYGVVAEHPELLDINFARDGLADWIHANAIDYNAELDQIMISSPFLSEIWVIDHSTTTEEAAGHSGGNSGMGGDILYRWGNPQGYDAGTDVDRKLFEQHHPHWIEPGLPGEGNVLIFNNGVNRPGGNYSTIDELETTVDSLGNYPQPGAGMAHGPNDFVWNYTAPVPTDFYAAFISGAQRLPNGNTLICDGAYGTIFEVTPDGETVWEYVSPVISTGPMTQGETIPATTRGTANNLFRATRYGPDYPGLAGRDLTPGDPIELIPVAINENAASLQSFALLQNYPNPFNPSTQIRFRIEHAADVSLQIYNVRGQLVETVVSERLAAGEHAVTWEAGNMPGGLYFYRLSSGDFTDVRKMVLLK